MLRKVKQIKQQTVETGSAESLVNWKRQKKY